MDRGDRVIQIRKTRKTFGQVFLPVKFLLYLLLALLSGFVPASVSVTSLLLVAIYIYFLQLNFQLNT